MEILETAYDHKVDFFEAKRIWRETNLDVPYSKIISNALTNRNFRRQEEPMNNLPRTLTSNKTRNDEPQIQHTSRMTEKKILSNQEATTNRHSEDKTEQYDQARSTSYSKTDPDKRTKSYQLKTEHQQKKITTNKMETVSTKNSFAILSENASSSDDETEETDADPQGSD